MARMEGGCETHPHPTHLPPPHPTHFHPPCLDLTHLCHLCLRHLWPHPMHLLNLHPPHLNHTMHLFPTTHLLSGDRSLACTPHQPIPHAMPRHLAIIVCRLHTHSSHHTPMPGHPHLQASCAAIPHTTMPGLLRVQAMRPPKPGTCPSLEGLLKASREP